MAFQLQEDLAHLLEEYKKRPISFTEFKRVQQIKLEEPFDKRISGKEIYFKRLFSETQKTHDLKGTTATNDAKLLEWKSSDN